MKLANEQRVKVRVFLGSINEAQKGTPAWRFEHGAVARTNYRQTTVKLDNGTSITVPTTRVYVLEGREPAPRKPARFGRCWYCGGRMRAIAASVADPPMLYKLCVTCESDPDVRAEVSLRGYDVVRREQELERAR